MEIEGSIIEITRLFRDFLAAEEHAYRNGYLQNVKAEIKIVAIISLVFLTISSDSIFYFLSIFFLSFFLAIASKIS
ncbi:MAG: hypothetical protein DRN29_06845, partial [Thermoplasmata archaeon]